MTQSRHLSVSIDRPVAPVYAFVADPANLSRWAAGLGGPAVRTGDGWFVETPAGRARITFAPANDYGVLDHEVVTPTGETVHVPMRVVADGEGCEVIFTVRRAPGASDEEFDQDAGRVGADLAHLKQILEGADA
jgi:Polyketide cyclase / dehydrase and lipid transport